MKITYLIDYIKTNNKKQFDKFLSNFPIEPSSKSLYSLVYSQSYSNKEKIYYIDKLLEKGVLINNPNKEKENINYIMAFFSCINVPLLHYLIEKGLTFTKSDFYFYHMDITKFKEIQQFISLDLNYSGIIEFLSINVKDFQHIDSNYIKNQEDLLIYLSLFILFNILFFFIFFFFFFSFFLKWTKEGSSR